MPSDVFYADMRAKHGCNLLDKVRKLYDAAGFQEIIQPRDLVALKMHFGEKGNTSYIRPQFVRSIVEQVRKGQGRPFLADTNTLYEGSRSNAVVHLITAVENGFSFAVVNAPLIIADGLTGKEYENIRVDLKHFREVKIASALVHADALLAVSHFKGHEATGFGGTLKNIGMGSGSRGGKQQMHSDLRPAIKRDRCKACGKCLKWCPVAAIRVDKQAFIEDEKCIGCGECTVTCPHGAVKINWKTEKDVFQEKIVEYAYGVLKDKKEKAGFFNFVMNVTPDCDCWSFSDAPLIGDVGILASRDPVALEQASIDLVNSRPVLPDSRLGSAMATGDIFRSLYPDIDWRVQLSYAETLGLGSRAYRLVSV